MHGCVVSSDLDLHLPPVAADEPPAIVLRHAPGQRRAAGVEAEDIIARIWQEPPGLRYYVARRAFGYRLFFDGIAEFEMSHDLAEVTWRSFESDGPGLVEVLAAGTLMAFRLALAGHLILHASVVRARDRGLAFVGGTGMGKSTMATLLCAGGAELLTDDIARVEVDGTGVQVWPGCTESRLRPGAASLVSVGAPEDRAARRTEDGRTAVSLPFWDGPAISLDAVVIPLPSPDHQCLRVERVTAANALICLSRFPRITGWTDAAIRIRQFDQMGEVARRVPVYLALLPWGPPFDADTGTALLDQLGWP